MDYGYSSMAFCENVKKNLAAHDTSINKFAGILGVNYRYLYRLLNGDRVMSLDMAFKISSVMGKSIYELSEDPGDYYGYYSGEEDDYDDDDAY